ncbi:MAG: M1 family metallopeptidase [Chloroflexi bacterium]|nr:M1 family metallopeptidase [Chloroflexota bacterium]
MRRCFALITLSILFLSACAPLPAPATPTRVVTVPPTATLAPMVTSAPAVPTTTPDPMATPRPTATPAPPLLDWSQYAAALRPVARQGLDPALDPAAGALLAGMTQYSLTVTLAPDLTRLAGAARIRYTNREDAPLAAVYLHLFPNLWNDGMTVSDVQAGGRPAAFTLESDDDLLKVPLAESLRPGDAVELALRFAEPIPANGNVGNYGEFAYLDNVLALAHFYPTVVVYDRDVSWHTETPALQGDVIYHDASLYDVALTLPVTMTVAATGATLDRVENGDGTATWRLVGGPLRDFNVVASGRFETTSEPVGDVLVNSYFLPEHAAGGKQALGWAVAAVRTYETAFGAYPYGELDVTETGTSAGGIEYPGLVVVASSLYDDPTRRDFFESATAHEVAHQWWYNVVGNDQVNAPWLDESLAQYATYLYFRGVYGQEGGQSFVNAMNQRWARVKYEEKAIGLPVAAYEGLEYGALVYGRGALFFLALRDRIGEKMMAVLLRRYYAEYAWRIATTDGFRKLAEEVSGQDLGELFKKWVY